MPNIRIMNWNIEQLGQTKIQINGIPEAIAEIVVSENIDVLTILELKTTNHITAQNIMDRLSAACNQKAVYLAVRAAALGAGVSLEVATDIAQRVIAPAPAGADILTVAQTARTTGVNAAIANIAGALPGGTPLAVTNAVNALAPGAAADPVAVAVRESATIAAAPPTVFHFGAMFRFDDVAAIITPVAVAAARATIGIAAPGIVGAVAADPVVVNVLGPGAGLGGGGALATVTAAVSLAVERAVVALIAARMVAVVAQGGVTNIAITAALAEVADMVMPGGLRVNPAAAAGSFNPVFIAAIQPVARAILIAADQAATAGTIVAAVTGNLPLGNAVAAAVAAALGAGFVLPVGISLAEAQALVVTQAMKAAVTHQLAAGGVAIGDGIGAAVAPVALAAVNRTTSNGGIAAPVVAAVTALYAPNPVPAAVAAALTAEDAVRARVDTAVANAMPAAAAVQMRIAQKVASELTPVALEAAQRAAAAVAMGGAVSASVASGPIVREAVARRAVAAAIAAAAPPTLLVAKQVAVQAALPPGGPPVPAAVVANAVTAADAAALAAEPGGVALAVAMKIPPAIALVLANARLNAALAPFGGVLANVRDAAITQTINDALMVGTPPNLDATVIAANAGNSLAVLAGPVIRAAAIAAAGAAAAGGVVAAVIGAIGVVAIANGPIATMDGAVRRAAPAGPPALTLAEARVAAVKAVAQEVARHFGASFTTAENIAAIVAPVAVASAVAANGAGAAGMVGPAVIGAAAPLLGTPTPAAVIAAGAIATDPAMVMAFTLEAKRNAAVEIAVQVSATQAGLAAGPATAVATAAGPAAIAVADAATIDNVPALLAKYALAAQTIVNNILVPVAAANVVGVAIQQALLVLLPGLAVPAAGAIANVVAGAASAQVGNPPAVATAAVQAAIVNQLTAVAPGAPATLGIANAVVGAVNPAVASVALRYTTWCLSEPTGTEHYGFLIKDINIVRPLFLRNRRAVMQDLNLHPFQANPKEAPNLVLPPRGNLGIFPLVNLHATSPFTGHPIGFTGQTLNNGGYNQGLGYRLPCLAMFQVNALGSLYPILPLVCCHYAAGRGNPAATAQIGELHFLHIAQLFDNGRYVDLNGRPKIVENLLFTGDFNISFLGNTVPILPRARDHIRTVRAYGTLTPTRAKGGSGPPPPAAAGAPAPAPLALPLDTSPSARSDTIPNLALRTAVTNVGTILHHYNAGAAFLDVVSLAGACFDNFFFGGTHVAAPGGPIAAIPPTYQPPVANADVAAIIDLAHRIDRHNYPASPGRMSVAAIAASYLAPPPGVNAGPHNAAAAPNLQAPGAALSPDDRLIGARFISDHLPVVVEYNIP